MGRREAVRRQRFERLRDFDRNFATSAWEAGFLAGVDEAGVGPLAGPVVAAAVILPAHFELFELNDSKQLPAAARRDCERRIRAEAVAFATARIWPPGIDRLNILRATLLAHRRALAKLAVRPEAVLIDGRWPPRWRGDWRRVQVEAVIGGDARSLAIAAASVVAKETRDRIMRRLDRRYPVYGFAKHKGYATEAHRQALREHGMSPVHRRSFCGWLEAEAALARQGRFDFAPAS
jgi:ribonuclease HII